MQQYGSGDGASSCRTALYLQDEKNDTPTVGGVGLSQLAKGVQLSPQTNDQP